MTENARKTNKHKQKRRRKLLRAGMAVLLSGVFIFSLVKLVIMGVSYLKNRNTYAEIRETAVFAEAPVQTPEVIWQEDVPAASASEQLPFCPDWAELKTVCPDIVGWLYLEDTNIHYPVVQCDNNEYYLDHNARREANAGGALFLDAYCGSDSQNLVIHGHRMKDDSMFGQLPDYAEKSFLTAHPVMYYLTPEQNYRVEIFACRTVKADAEYYKTVFASETAYWHYLEKAVEQSYWAAPVMPDTRYKTLTLSTCSVYRGMNDPRLLVHGLLVPID